MKICAFFILLTFSSCGNKNASKPEDHQLKTIKVMTYNIRHGDPEGGTNVNISNIAEVIKQQNPDLVAMQEVDSNTNRAPLDEVNALAQATGMFGYFIKSFNYQGGEYGNAILSRFPILEKDHYYLPNPNPAGRIQSVGIVTVQITKDLKIRFASTHFDLNSDNRIAQAQKLVELSKESTLPLIISGDLNATPDEQAIKILEGEYISGCTVKCPFTYSAKNPRRTIDYIMLNPKANSEMNVLSYTTVKNTYASDHLPLITVLGVSK